ncbi:MAG: hypothetical protein HYX40_10665 [Sphingobacteriales bacterium]|nr:hypothetical protein [Sphingobacteriales bacterium]
MKRLIIFLTLNLFTVSLFATDDHPIAVARSTKNINKKALSSFKTDFKNALATNWESAEDVSYVYFILNNENRMAAYDDEGELISTSRYIEYNNLPLSITMELAKKYPDYQKVGSVTEVSASTGSTYYFFTIVNNKQALRIKSSGDGFIAVTGKQKKYKSN